MFCIGLMRADTPGQHSLALSTTSPMNKPEWGGPCWMLKPGGNMDYKSTNERHPSLISSLDSSYWYKRFCPALGCSCRPSTKYFFLTFNSFVPIAQQAGQAVAQGRLLLLCVSGTNQGRTPFICTPWVPLVSTVTTCKGQPLSGLSGHKCKVSFQHNHMFRNPNIAVYICLILFLNAELPTGRLVSSFLAKVEEKFCSFLLGSA
jgi:hypothetical protein